MGLIYTTGTINQPDAGSVGLAMIEKIRDDVIAHAAWELAEEFTAASGLVRWYVFKCLAAQSGLASDFFVVIGRTLSNGEFRTAICEGYNAGTHTMSKYAVSSGSPVYDANGCAPSTYVLGTAVFSSSGTNPRYVTWTPAGTSVKWWVVAADDGFSVAFNGAANGFIHAGAYEPLSELSNAMPIQLIGHGEQTGVITRNPAAASTTINYQAMTIEGGNYTSIGIYGPLLGFTGDLRYNDKLLNNQRAVAEIGIVVALNSGDQVTHGYVLGKQKRVRASNKTTPVGFAFGDAYALEGRLWVPYKPDDGRVWDTGVPS